ncbi:MAG: 6-phosphogluconolactonase [Gemmatimonadales bacterium]|nr:6-phosphogluconolactonase [Gemmatimonadales bacterium]NIN12834.1 6-phosphogluconolactonase [Gemmatimonadales bacterium]NIN48762.1 6-phosphogluconolactonase [Gemmatimonadales bacterium]NIP06226.1 6-phosphogluconolactonase [Gemmatimonadales bacterium]NIR01411.1 6-phosphogluconolactonase [Gemmatimonadales bacterium]
METRVLIFDDAAALAEGAAREVVRSTRNAVRRRGRCALALAGGGTPRHLYQRLALPPHRGQIDWAKVQWFWGDERCVPPDDPSSNYRLANEMLLSRVSMKKKAVHRIRGELDPARAATLYEEEIRRTSGERTPRFDLILLGMGFDGHTASLFPDTPRLRDERRLVVATRSPLPPASRVTFTLHLINAARKVVVLVQGAAKAPVLARAVHGVAGDPAAPLPAALLRPARGSLLWFVDRAAAARLVP